MAMATPGGTTVLTSDVVNYLIYRYLQESGFSHTSFMFATESGVTRAAIDPNNVPPGSLVTFIQKGMQYLELEANLDAETGDVDGDFKALAPEELLSNDIDQLRALVQERKEKDEDRPSKAGGDKKKEARERQKADEKEQRAKEKEAKDKEKEAARDKPVKQEPKAPERSTGPAPMEEDTPSSIEIPSSSAITLNGHESEVYICAWNPVESLLASGSGDSTARIWNLNLGAPDYTKSVVLLHEAKQDKTSSKDVTTLDWHSDGSLLATGSYDGLARIWSKDGKLKQTLDKHQGPIFALKWSKKGDLLLSGSVDKTAIVWDAKSGEAKQVFELHTAPTLDVDWRNANSFATCSTDKLIHVCKLGDSKPLKTFSGHEDEVNAIKWDPSGRLLASCSDDKTAKVWSISSDKPMHDFRDHEREIYTIKWSPTGPGTANPNMQLLLASASFDTTVRLWDVNAGKCVTLLQRHEEPVYSVAFSPNGKLVATGSFDKCVFIWNVEDGQLVRSFKGDAGIYEVCWNKDGNRVAACSHGKMIHVLDVRM